VKSITNNENIEEEKISINITRKNKIDWDNFIKAYKIPTISKLVTNGVTNYINEKSSKYSNPHYAISHIIKVRLTTIKGYLQLILEKYKENLNNEIIKIIKNILEDSYEIERTIIDTFDKPKIKTADYDILIIEDDFATIDLLTNYFKSKDITVKGIQTGSKGLDELKLRIPKLILLDIILPDISGVEICKIIKSDEKIEKIPVFYLTALSNKDVEKKLVESKANGYILKPFNLSELNILLEYL
jgi:CheY-like chemotaxis protein